VPGGGVVGSTADAISLRVDLPRLPHPFTACRGTQRLLSERTQYVNKNTLYSTSGTLVKTLPIGGWHAPRKKGGRLTSP